jgi:cystathionine beta-lyase/cystathionine gamma-synthase
VGLRRTLLAPQRRFRTSGRELANIGIEGGHEAAERVVGVLRVLTSAVNFGGHQSLAEIAPHLMGEAGMEAHLGLICLSACLEPAAGLIADLQQALATA